MPNKPPFPPRGYPPPVPATDPKKPDPKPCDPPDFDEKIGRLKRGETL